MAEKKVKIDKRPPLGRYGGVRPVQRKLKTSETLYKNKEHIAAELLTLGTSSIMDIMDLDGTIKPLDQIPEYALRAIKKIQVTKDGVNIEMHDKVATLRVLAKAVGMLDGPEQNEDKPSIVGINMRGPTAEYMEVHDAEEEERKVSRSGTTHGDADDVGPDESEGVSGSDGDNRDAHNRDVVGETEARSVDNDYAGETGESAKEGE
jgi:hypothetical protein